MKKYIKEMEKVENYILYLFKFGKSTKIFGKNAGFEPWEWVPFLPQV